MHRKTNTSIDYSGVEPLCGLEGSYTLQGFKGRLVDMFHVLEVSGLLEEAGISREYIPFSRLMLQW